MRLLKILLTLPCAVLLTSAAHACSVCFGGANSNMVRGFTWGIWILLLLPFVMMAIFVSAIARAIRKNKSHV